MTTRKELIEEIANDLISKLEDWESSGNSAFINRIPVNVTSEKMYRGINTLLLSFSELSNRYDSSEWGTFKQWQQKGCQIKKGEHSQTVVFWSPVTYKTEVKDEQTGEIEVEEHQTFVGRKYHVFNASQVEGLEQTIPVVLDTPEHKENSAMKYFNSCVKIETCESGFSSTENTIFMKPRSEFSSVEAYMAQMCYLTASSIRKQLTKDNDDKYPTAFEELVSEIAAGFISAFIGFSYKFSDENIHYIHGWIDMLNANKKLVFNACSEAQKIFDHFVNAHSNLNDIFDSLV